MDHDFSKILILIIRKLKLRQCHYFILGNGCTNTVVPRHSLRLFDLEGSFLSHKNLPNSDWGSVYTGMRPIETNIHNRGYLIWSNTGYHDDRSERFATKGSHLWSPYLKTVFKRGILWNYLLGVTYFLYLK